MVAFICSYLFQFERAFNIEACHGMFRMPTFPSVAMLEEITIVMCTKTFNTNREIYQERGIGLNEKMA